MTDPNKLADELEGLAKDASPGHWRVTTCMDYWIEHGRTPTDADEGFKGVGHFGDMSWPNMGERQGEWEANAALIIALRNNLPDILSALRDAGKMREASLFVVDNDEGQSWDRLDQVADALTDYGAEPCGFGKVYRWSEMEPVWVIVDTVDGERVITEYATEEAARLALKTEGE